MIALEGIFVDWLLRPRDLRNGPRHDRVEKLGEFTKMLDIGLDSTAIHSEFSHQRWLAAGRLAYGNSGLA